MKNLYYKLAVAALALAPALSHAEDSATETILNGLTTKGTAMFGAAAILGGAVIIWAIGRKLIKKAV